MPTPVVTMRLGEDLANQVRARGDELGPTVREVLTTHLALLEEGRRRLRGVLTPEECGCIVTAFNGTLIEDQMRLGRAVWPDGRRSPVLAAEVFDAFEYEPQQMEQWGADKGALMEKLHALDDTQALALLDAVQRFWLAVGRGDQRDPKALLEEAK